MGDTSVFLNQGIKYAQEAIDQDKEACLSNDPAKYELAVKTYLKAIDYYLSARKFERNERTRALLYQKIEEYVGRAEVLKQWVLLYNKHHGEGGGTAGPSSGDGGEGSNGSLGEPAGDS